jgi:uncharacterized YigZ family protein
MAKKGAKYLTLEGVSEGFYKEKGSKFIAYAIPCTSENEVKQHISQLRRENPQACHVCSAFRLGSDKKTYRSSDDGEPSNSAGPPILGQIQSFDLTNVLIAVVRYYGGTNLGVGGLITAYKTSAKQALENAKIVETEDSIRIDFQFAYEELSTAMKLMKKPGCRIIKQEINSICQFTVEIPVSDEELINEIQTRYLQE